MRLASSGRPVEPLQFRQLQGLDGASEVVIKQCHLRQQGEEHVEELSLRLHLASSAFLPFPTQSIVTQLPLLPRSIVPAYLAAYVKISLMHVFQTLV